MNATETLQRLCVSSPSHYTWAVQLQPITPRVTNGRSTLERMFFGGEPVFHVVKYEQHRRAQLERRGGALCITAARRRQALVLPGTVANLGAKGLHPSAA